jgi:hypothetical protein
MNDPNPPLLAVARTPVGSGRRSDRILCELLALNQEMIVQLRLEGKSIGGTTDFIEVMIAQHEQAAERLRAQLKHHASSASRARIVSLNSPLTG